MRRFSDVLNDLGLRDLPLQGGPYTWLLGEPLKQGDPEMSL